MGWTKKDVKIRAIDGLEWSIYGVDVLFTTDDMYDVVGLRQSLGYVRENYYSPRRSKDEVQLTINQQQDNHGEVE